MQLCSILGTGTTQEKNEERTWIPKAVVGYGKKGISGGIGSEGGGWGVRGSSADQPTSPLRGTEQRFKSYPSCREVVTKGG